MEKNNPNRIGNIISISEDINTYPESVYRSLRSDDAISDIYTSGIVRSKEAAGISGRFGDVVYWSKGEEGKNHIVQEGGYVIEAPNDIAKERHVEKNDLTAIYTKKEGAVFILHRLHLYNLHFLCDVVQRGVGEVLL